VLCISNGKLYSGCRRSRRPQAKKCGEGSLANAGGQWPKSPKYLRRLESFCLCLLHIPLVIHIRQHGSSIIAYRQIACCQSMQIHQQLMVVQAVTNSSAVGCLFCWASLNSSPPSSRDSGRRLYHALSLRSSQSHPTIPQAAANLSAVSYPTVPSRLPKRSSIHISSLPKSLSSQTQTMAETSVAMPTSSSSLTESPCKTPLPRWLCCSS
jgi:hypothetical protein